jgi:hypothetical protein
LNAIGLLWIDQIPEADPRLFEKHQRVEAIVGSVLGTKVTTGSARTLHDTDTLSFYQRRPKLATAARNATGDKASQRSPKRLEHQRARELQVQEAVQKRLQTRKPPSESPFVTRHLGRSPSPPPLPRSAPVLSSLYCDSDAVDTDDELALETFQSLLAAGSVDSESDPLPAPLFRSIILQSVSAHCM